MQDDFGEFEEDPTQYAGLFEGDIDNVSMDDFKASVGQRVSFKLLFMIDGYIDCY